MSSGGMDDDELFSTGGIFADRRLLRVGHVPDETRIVGRNEEMKYIGNALGPATNSGPPDNLLIYGKTGTGKSLVAQHVTHRARDRATAQDVTFTTAYIDCSNDDTETRVAREMTFQVKKQQRADMHIPEKGIGATEYYRDLWRLLKSQDVFVVILDEIDKLQSDNVLMQLTRAEESGKTDCYVGIIAISNKIQYRQKLSERVLSSFQDEEHVFDPYDATQLTDILDHRRDAFRDDVLEQGTIQLASALAAQEHGDARKAIDILYEAGKMASRDEAAMVTRTHIRNAKEQAEINRFKELISGSTPHAKYALQALALLTREHDSRVEFRTNRIYKRYRYLVEATGRDPLKKDSIYRILDEQAFLGVTESYKTIGGRGEGSYLEHTLLTDPEIVLEAVAQSTEDLERTASN